MIKLFKRVIILISYGISLTFISCNISDASVSETVNLSSISGVSVPISGETPITSIVDTEQYSGVVTWSNSPTTFLSETIYTAKITLSAKSGYTFDGINENFFSVPGATSVKNNRNSGVVTAIFPSTSSEPPIVVNLSTISGVTIPTFGETPITSIVDTEQYYGVVTWSNSPTTFLSGTIYTAKIILTAKDGYTFNGISENFFSVPGATSITNSSNSSEITAIFPTTEKFDFSVVLNSLEYPKALFLNNNNLYFTETASRNTSFGGKLTLNQFNLTTNRLTLLMNNPSNSDALTVSDNIIYLSSYHNKSPGEYGKVSIFNLSTYTEQHLLNIEIATQGMCIDDNKNIYILGSSEKTDAKSLYKLPHDNYSSPEVLLTGLGRIWTIAYYKNLLYFSDLNNIYSYNLIDQTVVLINKTGILGIAVTDNYIYYSDYFNHKLGRINLKTKKDTIISDNIKRPSNIVVDRINNSLFLLSKGTIENELKDGQLIKIDIIQ